MRDSLQVKKGKLADQPISKRPGASYLVPVQKPMGDSCTGHSKSGAVSGAWVVVCPMTGSQFMFSPPTQVQKDIWLSAEKGMEVERMSMLRWFCFECGTVQKP
jgi:hypothetical protein